MRLFPFPNVLCCFATVLDRHRAKKSVLDFTFPELRIEGHYSHIHQHDIKLR